MHQLKYINLNMFRILHSFSLLMAMLLLTFSSCKGQKIIETGAEQIADYLPLLQNKTVAIVGNQTSMIGNTHLVDSLIT